MGWAQRYPSHSSSSRHRLCPLLANRYGFPRLTGLPNRNLLKDHTKQANAQAQRKHENFAPLFLYLDRFKTVNNSMEHVAGERKR
ncbi:MAG: diguanylate cyclase [Gammaproteobacteria bacterium]|nr:diguanylate cyclase [Gammaproteobacteria bacterium]